MSSEQQGGGSSSEWDDFEEDPPVVSAEPEPSSHDQDGEKNVDVQNTATQADPDLTDPFAVVGAANTPLFAGGGSPNPNPPPEEGDPFVAELDDVFLATAVPSSNLDSGATVDADVAAGAEGLLEEIADLDDWMSFESRQPSPALAPVEVAAHAADADLFAADADLFSAGAESQSVTPEPTDVTEAAEGSPVSESGVTGHIDDGDAREVFNESARAPDGDDEVQQEALTDVNDSQGSEDGANTQGNDTDGDHAAAEESGEGGGEPAAEASASPAADTVQHPATVAVNDTTGQNDTAVQYDATVQNDTTVQYDATVQNDTTVQNDATVQNDSGGDNTDTPNDDGDQLARDSGGDVGDGTSDGGDTVGERVSAVVGGGEVDVPSDAAAPVSEEPSVPGTGNDDPDDTSNLSLPPSQDCDPAAGEGGNEVDAFAADDPGPEEPEDQPESSLESVDDETSTAARDAGEGTDAPEEEDQGAEARPVSPANGSEQNTETKSVTDSVESPPQQDAPPKMSETGEAESGASDTQTDALDHEDDTNVQDSTANDAAQTEESAGPSIEGDALSEPNPVGDTASAQASSGHGAVAGSGDDGWDSVESVGDGGVADGDEDGAESTSEPTAEVVEPAATSDEAGKPSSDASDAVETSAVEAAPPAMEDEESEWASFGEEDSGDEGAQVEGDGAAPAPDTSAPDVAGPTQSETAPADPVSTRQVAAPTESAAVEEDSDGWDSFGEEDNIPETNAAGDKPPALGTGSSGVVSASKPPAPVETMPVALTLDGWLEDDSSGSGAVPEPAATTSQKGSAPSVPESPSSLKIRADAVITTRQAPGSCVIVDVRTGEMVAKQIGNFPAFSASPKSQSNKRNKSKNTQKVSKNTQNIPQAKAQVSAGSTGARERSRPPAPAKPPTTRLSKPPPPPRKPSRPSVEQLELARSRSVSGTGGVSGGGAPSVSRDKPAASTAEGSDDSWDGSDFSEFEEEPVNPSAVSAGSGASPTQETSSVTCSKQENSTQSPPSQAAGQAEATSEDDGWSESAEELVCKTHAPETVEAAAAVEEDDASSQSERALQAYLATTLPFERLLDTQL